MTSLGHGKTLSVTRGTTGGTRLPVGREEQLVAHGYQFEGRNNMKRRATWSVLGAVIAMAIAIPALAGTNAHAMVEPIYADGSVGCPGADDVSNRVGTVMVRPVEEGVAFHLVLTDAAPNWNYYVELSQAGTCLNGVRYTFSTGRNGQAIVDGIYPVSPGDYTILVDVVSNPSNNVPPDPTRREMAPGGLISITVP